MIFVRVHTVRGSLTAQQKRHLRVQLIAAVAEVGGPVNNDSRESTSGVQMLELRPENRYLGSDHGESLDEWQVEVITPHEVLQTSAVGHRVVTTGTAVVHRAVGDGALPARGPQVEVHTIPWNQWSTNSKMTDRDALHARLAASSAEAAWADLDQVFGPERTVGE